MTAGRICVRSIDVAHGQETVMTAARRMSDRNVGTLVVINERREPIGVLTDRDLTVRVLARARNPNETIIQSVMTPDPETVTESTPIEDVLRVMRKGTCRRTPVVADDGTLVGLVSLDDVLSLLASEFGSIGRLLRAETPDSMAQVD